MRAADRRETNAGKRGAAFLDRDGTIIFDAHYIGDPKQVKLLPGAGAAVRLLNDAGWPVIVVTNQSGIARGLFTMAEYERVHARFIDLLAADGGTIDATYMCPHHPDFTGICECRKPGTLLFRRAAYDFDLDVTASWYVGDKLRDVLPAGELHGHGILIPNSETTDDQIATARAEFEVAASLDEACRRIIESAR
ncbi:MAG TPA: HAD family hydrolase [Gemmatimonadaceae bacterium]|nr:HAD family hydrolase [Gemmatimonadaceae bacterium]